MNSSNWRASKIIWNDTKIEQISWELTVENRLFDFCVGVWVGRHPATNFSLTSISLTFHNRSAHVIIIPMISIVTSSQVKSLLATITAVAAIELEIARCLLDCNESAIKSHCDSIEIAIGLLSECNQLAISLEWGHCWNAVFTVIYQCCSILQAACMQIPTGCTREHCSYRTISWSTSNRWMWLWKICSPDRKYVR